MNKNHNNSPLPFQGQKRNFVKQFKIELEKYSDTATYVDLFGGSGLLSHIVKQEKPKSKVIYNDYDNFKQRIEVIPITNKLLSEIRLIMAKTPKNGAVPKKIKERILKVIKKADRKGYVDYISLSANLLFSMSYVTNYIELTKQKFYNHVRMTDYNAKGYLQGVEVVTYDYKVLFEKYKKDKTTIFLVDPPYLSTDCQTYKNYWKLTDYLDVLKVLYNSNYFYFTSNKSSIIELMEWIETNTAAVNPFKNAKIVYHYNSTTHNTGYTDVMLHKGYTTTTTFN